MASDRSLANSRSAIALVCVLVTSGCSLSIQGPDPDRPRNQVPVCDTGKGGVAMDGLMVTLLGLGAIAALNADEGSTGAALGLTGGLFLASALRGNNAAEACRTAFSEYNVAYNQMRNDPVVGQLQDVPPPKPKPAVKKPPVPTPQTTLEPEPPVVANPSPEVAPEYAAPRPPPVKKEAPPKADPEDDDWSSFWKEVP